MSKLAEILKRYTSIPALIDILHRKQIPLLDPQGWDDRNDRYFMALYKQHRGIEGLYGMCATQSKETYHHWRVFTEGNTGACIEINKAALEESLRSQNGYRCQIVRYATLSEAKNLGSEPPECLPFLKRHGFTDEKEYRLIYEDSQPQRGAHYIDLPYEMIETIHFNPWLPAKISESLKQVILNIISPAKITIRQSALIDSRTWKEAGDKLVNRTL